MKAIRVEYSGEGELPAPGSYWQMHGNWWAMTPNGMLANLVQHRVEENDDGSITVAPSILTTTAGGGPSWHGHLEDGVWREC